MNKFWPELRNVLKDKKLPLPLKESFAIYRKLFGVLGKILWAFLWQEEFIVVKALTGSAILREIGAYLTPTLNHLLDFMT